jgi:lipoate-protein ligase A
MTNPRFPFTTWRVTLTQPASGAWNMAVDEAILESIQAGESLPVLRLFAWSPPCLSLGHAQPFTDINFARLTALGWDVVRRITGGRAILHTDEMTYSVIGPNNEPRLEGGVIESYRRLSVALLAALDDLGLPARALSKSTSGSQNSQDQKPVCFEVPSNYEITVHGKKLIGSAQARKKTAILQHGTLPLYGDLTRIINVLNFPDEASRDEAKGRLLNRATTVETELNKPISWDQAASAFIDAFEKTLNISFRESEITPAELSRTVKLIKEKYAHPSWTERI